MCQGGDHSKKGIYRGDHTIAVTHARTWKVQTLRSKRMGPPNQIRPYVLESSRTINPYEKNFPISTISYIYIYISNIKHIYELKKSPVKNFGPNCFWRPNFGPVRGTNLNPEILKHPRKTANFFWSIL